MTNIFQLSLSTYVNRAIHKNAFDEFTDTKEKKDFVDKIDKIRWLYKIATDTTNLPSREVVELQVFVLSIRKKDEIPGLLKVIDRSINRLYNPRTREGPTNNRFVFISGMRVFFG